MPMTKQSPLRITVPAIKHRPPKYAALQTLNPSMLPNRRTNYRPSRNKSRRQSKRLSELRSISSFFFYPTPISLIISTFWLPNYIGEKLAVVGSHSQKSVTATREQRSRSVNITPRGRRDVNRGRQSSPDNRVHATKNNYR